MTLAVYDFRSPAALIEEVAGRIALVENTVYVVLVARPSTEQHIVAIRRLATPARIDGWQDASAEIREVMEELTVPERPTPPDHSALTVLVRRGLCVFGPNEGQWMSAWRYSNHLSNCYGGRIILVTEHGWADFMTHTAGQLPAMAD